VWVRINATVKQQVSKHQKPKGQNCTNIDSLSLKNDLALREDADKKTNKQTRMQSELT